MLQLLKINLSQFRVGSPVLQVYGKLSGKIKYEKFDLGEYISQQPIVCRFPASLMLQIGTIHHHKRRSYMPELPSFCALALDLKREFMSCQKAWRPLGPERKASTNPNTFFTVSPLLPLFFIERNKIF